jgi:hypothetical protein
LSNGKRLLLIKSGILISELMNIFNNKFLFVFIPHTFCAYFCLFFLSQFSSHF